MNNLSLNIRIKVNENLYLKDPESSELGMKIVSESIELIDEMGFESFNFKKLSQNIQSTEASVYRYFENKHKLLMYLTAWYWSWMEYLVLFNITNVTSPEEQLIRALKTLSEDIQLNDSVPFINEVKLSRIIIAESSKAYLVKEVDEINKLGAYRDYKNLVGIISDIIKQINPDYPYPHMLISTIIEGIHHQRFFAEHLPRLTDKVEGVNFIEDFSKDLVLKAIVR